MWKRRDKKSVHRQQLWLFMDLDLNSYSLATYGSQGVLSSQGALKSKQDANHNLY